MTPGQPLTVEQRVLLERLVREAGPRVHAYVRRAFPRLDADEVLAETFFRAARAAAGLQQSPDPLFYLLRTARTVCLRELQRQVPAESVPDDLADRSAEPAGRLRLHEELADMQRAIAELPEAQREVVVLRYSAGLSFEQVAELLEIPLGTALSRMNTAQRTLRAIVERSLEHPRT